MCVCDTESIALEVGRREIPSLYITPLVWGDLYFNMQLPTCAIVQCTQDQYKLTSV